MRSIADHAYYSMIFVLRVPVLDDIQDSFNYYMLFSVSDKVK